MHNKRCGTTPNRSYARRHLNVARDAFWLSHGIAILTPKLSHTAGTLYNIGFEIYSKYEIRNNIQIGKGMLYAFGLMKILKTNLETAPKIGILFYRYFSKGR
jgi:hypothetical protein